MLPHSRQYLLRPEFIESTFALYKATTHPFFLQVGKIVLNDIDELTRTNCGFACISDVQTRRLEDRMDSYFLSETLKYLYLLFDEESPLNLDEFILTTEGHFMSVPKAQGNSPHKFFSESASFDAHKCLKEAIQVATYQQKNTVIINNQVIQNQEVIYFKSDPNSNAILFQTNLQPIVTFNEEAKLEGCIFVFINKTLVHHFPMMEANFGREIPLDGLHNVSLTTCIPQNACKSVLSGLTTNKAVLVSRGGCSFHTKAMNLDKSEAKVLIVYESQGDDLVIMTGGEEPQQAINLFPIFVGKSCFDALYPILNVVSMLIIPGSNQPLIQKLKTAYK